jgi:nucleoside-specific outer membrane channel protein Tsx
MEGDPPFLRELLAMRTSILRRFSTAALVSAALVTLPARADQPGFATANIQVLNAWNMIDPATGNNPTKGDQTVVTFNYFSTWDLGDVNVFVDFNRARGHFEGATDDARVYGEIAPRIGLGKAFGVKVPGFRDLGPAFELNHGGSFYAYLAGIGGDFALPQPYVLGLNLYYRYDKFVGDTYQATTFWGIPFAVGPARFAFKGFADFTEGKDFAGKKGLDLMTQPELLLDVGAFFGKPGKLWAGTEYWLHKHPVRDVQALQAMVEWTIR